MLSALREMGERSVDLLPRSEVEITADFQNSIASVLNVPEDYEVVCILPVGKAADEYHAPGKKPFSERVRFNSWS